MNRKKLADVLILAGITILVLNFAAPLFYEAKFQINSFSGKRYQVVDDIGSKGELIIPESLDFGIVIPKIAANAKIFPNVNPFDEKEFLPILRRGVAHAKGTSFPGLGKNIYLFAHSTDAFYNAGRYNAVFYLIGKLNDKDEIDIFYKNKLFRYSVFEKKVVAPGEINYLEPQEEEILTLQTCYPPGTTLRRLVVRAKLQDGR